jgi:hydroxylaminobenzene mutase
MQPTAPIQRFLGQAGAVLILLGLFTGFYVAAAMTGQVPANGHMALSSHLNALLGAFWIFAVAWSVPLLGFGEVGLRRLAWGVVIANYANWGITAVKAWLNVAGIDFVGKTANDVVFIALSVFVVVPALATGIAWVVAFRRGRA